MRLRRASAVAAVPRGSSVVLVALGERRVAVPAARIVEVARVAAYTPLPCEDPTHLGVVLHREALIPLVDVGARLGSARPGPLELPALCVFVRTGRGEVAFPVDRVLGIQPSADGRPEEGVVVLDPDVLGGRHGESAPR